MKETGMMEMKTLNKEQVTALFEKEAVLQGTENRVPDFRAVALFGSEAVEHAFRLNLNKCGYYANIYSTGKEAISSLTFRGFQAAASFFNVQLLKREMG